MQTWIAKAGPYAVRKFPCRDYAGPLDMRAPRTGVIHTTEGGAGLPLAEFKSHFAPHFTLNDKEIVQCLPIGRAGAALEHHVATGIVTNSIVLCQIEVAGKSSEKPWMPSAETAKRLAALMATMFHLFGVPLSRPFPAGTWGKAGDNPNRHAGHFGKVAGWYGHGDIPTNTHWDPGALKWDELFKLAATFEPKPEEPADATGHA